VKIHWFPVIVALIVWVACGLILWAAFRRQHVAAPDAYDVQPNPGADGEPDEGDDFDRSSNPALLAAGERVDAWRALVRSGALAETPDPGPGRHRRQLFATLRAWWAERSAPVLLGWEGHYDELRTMVGELHDPGTVRPDDEAEPVAVVEPQPDELVEDGPAKDGTEEEAEQPPAVVDAQAPFHIAPGEVKDEPAAFDAFAAVGQVPSWEDSGRWRTWETGTWAALPAAYVEKPAAPEGASAEDRDWYERVSA
jgi:hypothetical protein